MYIYIYVPVVLWGTNRESVEARFKHLSCKNTYQFRMAGASASSSAMHTTKANHARSKVHMATLFNGKGQLHFHQKRLRGQGSSDGTNDFPMVVSSKSGPQKGVMADWASQTVWPLPFQLRVGCWQGICKGPGIAEAPGIQSNWGLSTHKNSPVFFAQLHPALSYIATYSKLMYQYVTWFKHLRCDPDVCPVTESWKGSVFLKSYVGGLSKCICILDQHQCWSNEVCVCIYINTCKYTCITVYNYIYIYIDM